MASSLGDWAEVASALVALVALVVALSALRRDRSSEIAEVRHQWEAIHEHWTRTVLTFRGPDDYYADASPEQREQLRSEMAAHDGADINEQINLMRGYTYPVRTVGRFLAGAANGVLAGRISVRRAYDIFGPEVARHRAVCYWVAGLGRDGAELDFMDAAPTDNWGRNLDQVPETPFYDEAARIGLLYELLWAEMSRRGDMYFHRLIERARWIQETGHFAIQDEWAKKAGRSPAGFVRRLLLRRQLGYARRVRLSALAADPDPLFEPGFERYMVKRVKPSARLRRRYNQLRRKRVGWPELT